MTKIYLKRIDRVVECSLAAIPDLLRPEEGDYVLSSFPLRATDAAFCQPYTTIVDEDGMRQYPLPFFDEDEAPLGDCCPPVVLKQEQFYE
jgi:hypothetical protein